MGTNGQLCRFAGFDVTGTSITPADTDHARARLNSIAARGLAAQLPFEVVPMESVAKAV